MNINRRHLIYSGFGAAATFSAGSIFNRPRAAEPIIELTAQVSRQKLYGEDNPDSVLWSFNGSSPGPDLATARSVKLIMSGGAMGRPADIYYEGKKLVGNDFRQTGQLWAFNGVANLSSEPLFSATRGETVLLEIVNNTVFPHAMHVHGHHFQVMGSGNSFSKQGLPWIDTFLIDPQQSRQIAFVADNPGKWLLHCHMLEHAAAGMNTWFNVGWES